MAEIEFEVPGPHPPCRQTMWTSAGFENCFSTERAIRHVPKNMGKMLVCGSGHNQRAGKAFIPGWEFDEGEQFYDIVPPEYLPTATSKRASRWKIPAEAPINEQDVDICVSCEKPPYDIFGGPDIGNSWSWLEQHEPLLIAEVHSQIAGHPGVDLREWPGLINDDLRRRIRERLDMSLLQIDHGVPRKIGDELWSLLTGAERRFLQISLLLKLCRRCNGVKSKKLLPREEIEAYYVATYYDGFRAAAVAESARWAILDRTLTKIYANKAVG
jgi:hypothetical protein